MLFLITLTFKAENKDAIFKRLQEKGTLPPPPGMKWINMWSSLKGKKLTILAEAEKPGPMMEFADMWDDLADLDYDVVMPTEDVPKLEYAQKKYAAVKV